MVLGLSKFPSRRGVPEGRGVLAALFAVSLFLGCVDAERSNPYDENGNNFNPSLLGWVSSSSVLVYAPSSSSVGPGYSSPVPSSGSLAPSSGSQVPSSGSQEPSSGSQVPSSGSQEPSSSSPASSSGSQEPSSGSQVPSSSSSALSSGSLASSSSLQASSSGAVPEPIATGELAFKGFDYGVGGSYYYIGTSVTLGSIESTVAVSNAAEAGCGEISIELSGCGAPGPVTTTTANCAITARATATCVNEKRTFKTVTATVVPDPSISGSCAWESSIVATGSTAQVAAEPSIQNAYGRSCEGPYFLVGGERKSNVFAGLTVVENSSGDGVVGMNGITVGATCGGKETAAISCPNIAVGRYDSRDQLAYKVTRIGTQTWMAENLNHNASGSKCYSNLDSNCDKYGRLYNWATAMSNVASSTAVPSGVRGICPEGWHLPSRAEWEVMTAYIGGANTEGKKLKAKSGWNSNGNGTDDYGFSALPGGDGSSGGSFGDVGNYGFWWSASEFNSYGAYHRNMYDNYEYAYWDYDGKANLFSVRCLQD